MGGLLQTVKMERISASNNSFGEKVRSWRRAHKVLQIEFAEAIGTLGGQLQRWETHLSPPRADFALKIAKQMGTTLEYLVDESIPNMGGNVPAYKKSQETEKGRLIAWYVKEIGEDEAVRRLTIAPNGLVAKVESESITDAEYKQAVEQQRYRRRKA